MPHDENHSATVKVKEYTSVEIAPVCMPVRAKTKANSPTWARAKSLSLRGKRPS